MTLPHPSPTSPHPRRWRRWAGPVALAVLAACSGGDDAAAPTGEAPEPEEQAPEEQEPEQAWPVPDWNEVSADAAELDAAALEAMATAAEAGGSECLVVSRGGEIVGEWYWRGFDAEREREAFSVTKSVTSTLVGLAQERGLLDIEEPASKYIEEWQGTPSERVTIRNLISNDSGRYQDFVSDYIDMTVNAEDKTAFAIGLSQQHEPGTTWVYNNAAIQTLEAVLEEATGMPVAEFAEEALFDPIGMESEISTDAAGNTLTFMGLQASCLDLTRFGLLFERGGEWAGEQVVPADWVAEATTPSTDLTDDYGFLWWLGLTAETVGTTGAAEESTPDPAAEATGTPGMFAALGFQGQVVNVFPEWDIVVTRMGAATGDDGATTFGIRDIVEGVTAAVGDDAG